MTGLLTFPSVRRSRSSVSAGNVEPRQLTAEIVTTGGAIIALAAGLTFAQGVHAAEGLSDLAGQAQHVPNVSPRNG